MRIIEINIEYWRNFANLKLKLDSDARLVCIVGGNGTGKTHLLELLGACAHKLGLSQGIELSRRDPFSERHKFSLQFYLAKGINTDIDQGMVEHDWHTQWDRTLTICSEKSQRSNDPKTTVDAGGIVGNPDYTAESCARQIVERIKASESVHFLSLDANRAYPKKVIKHHEMAAAYEVDWRGAEYTKNRSYMASSTLYDEWVKYFLTQENKAGTRLIQASRRAQATGGDRPEFQDHYQAYKTSLQKVLPHLTFTGVDLQKKILLFDVSDSELSFDQLSGGEREIAFLIGQIDRFGLRQGLFLLDEPEHHLNADLIREWVGYLTSTVETGQIWLATHSLEAVEAAGQQSTFVLERNEQSRLVDSVVRLDSQPVLSALSRSVGTPAFSISQLRFVFIEGEEAVGERERFRNLAGSPQDKDIRFMECGSCEEVMRRVKAIRTIARESNVEIRVAGVVDKDFRMDYQAARFSKDNDIHVLTVHEVENFFLHTETLQALLKQNGNEGLKPEELIRSASDLRAGCWIFQHAMALDLACELPEIPLLAKKYLKGLNWDQISPNENDIIKTTLGHCQFDKKVATTFRRFLTVSVRSYKKRRSKPDLWKQCEGKQVLNEIASKVGFADSHSLISAAFTYWENNKNLLPDEILTFREYLSKI